MSKKEKAQDVTTLTDSERFTNNVKVTESIVPKLNVNLNGLKNALRVFVASANVINQYKRQMFYPGAELDYKVMIEQLNEIGFAIGGQPVIHDAESMLYGLQTYEKQGRETLPHENTRFIHGALGMATESAEVVESLLNYLNTGELDAANVNEEVGDTEYYAAVTVDSLGLTLDDARGAVVTKLRRRYPDGAFSTDHALNRDLEAERKILEDAVQTTEQ